MRAQALKSVAKAGRSSADGSDRVVGSGQRRGREPSLDRVPISSRNSFFASNATAAGEMSEEDFLYKLASEDKESFEFFSKHTTVPTSRSPYSAGMLMCRGAAYYPKFKEYIEKGGIARFKNSVVASIRVNAIHTFDEMNGSFAVSYFLDLAFWVPKFDVDFYKDESTLGSFARYEPQIFFPDTISAKIINRSVEFSKDPKSRRHEIQLGQNGETLTKLRPGLFLKLSKGYEPKSSVVIHGYNPQAHWPRLWRVLASEEDIKAVHNHGNHHKKNDYERAAQYSNEMRLKLQLMDEERNRMLSKPHEGILFITHEVEAVCLEHFDLVEFPYDTQAMTIKVRVQKAPGDPLNRFLVPLCIDKAFFCTSRVAPMVEWMIAKNLHWEVTAGAGGDPSRDGGKQRLITRVLVCRKSYYYTLHYVIMAFSISTISFTAFTIDPENITARINVVLTILLTVVAFNYVCQDKIPKVPYSTILDKFLICNHIAILIVGLVIILVSYIDSNKEDLSNNFLFGFGPQHESTCGIVLFFIWIFGNAVFGGNTMLNVKTVRHNMDFSEQLEFLDFSGTKIANRKYVDELRKTNKFIERTRCLALQCYDTFFSCFDYYKYKKHLNKLRRKKELHKLERRGFEVCGFNMFGEPYYEGGLDESDDLDKADEDDIVDTKYGHSASTGELTTVAALNKTVSNSFSFVSKLSLKTSTSIMHEQELKEETKGLVYMEPITSENSEPSLHTTSTTSASNSASSSSSSSSSSTARGRRPLPVHKPQREYYQDTCDDISTVDGNLNGIQGTPLDVNL